jgi:hypothetical protein
MRMPAQARGIGGHAVEDRGTLAGTRVPCVAVGQNGPRGLSGRARDAAHLPGERSWKCSPES